MSNTEQAPVVAPAPAAPARAATAARKASGTVVQAFEQAHEQAVNNLKQGVATATANAKAFGAQAFDFDKAVKAMQDVAAFNRGTVEALVKSSQILANGTQDLYRQAASSAQTAVTEALAGFKALAAVKSVKEGVQLQASLARSSMERALSEGNQFAQSGLKLAEQAAAPLAERARLAAEQFGRRAA